MGKNALALGADLLCPDRVGNLTGKYLDFTAVVLPQQCADLLCEVRAAVHHGQQDAVDLELRVNLPPYLVDRREELFQALGREVFRLDGNQYPVGGGKGVDRQHPQGGLAVNEDVGVLPFHRVQVLPQDGFTAHGIHQRNLHAGQLDVAGHEVDALRVAQDTLAGCDGLIGQHLSHHVGEGDRQVVRLVVA